MLPTHALSQPSPALPASRSLLPQNFISRHAQEGARVLPGQSTDDVHSRAAGALDLNPSPLTAFAAVAGKKSLLHSGDASAAITQMPLSPAVAAMFDAASPQIVAETLDRIVQEQTAQIRDVRRDIRRGDAPQSSLEPYFASLNVIADVASKAGDAGRAILQRYARAVYGSNALIVESAPGTFALWNNAHELAPVMAAQLPTPVPLTGMSMDVKRLRRPPAIGRAPADLLATAQTPKLAHLAAALPTSALRVADLFDEDMIAFVRAPDPTLLLASAREAHAAAPGNMQSAGAVELSVLSYNVALLDYKLFGGSFFEVTYSQSPLIEARLELLGDAIFTADDDVIMLQEVWLDKDVKTLSAQAVARGYRVFVSPRTKYTDGLVTFVKEELIAPDTAPQQRAKSYEAQDWTEWWGAELTSLFTDVGIKRGFNEISFEHAALGEVRLYNTHSQAFPGAWMQRMQQAREMGLVIADRPEESLALIGGDHNAAPYYPSDSRRDSEGVVTHDWWKNAISYPLLQHYAGVDDLAVAGRAAHESDDDIEMQHLPAGAQRPAGWPFTVSHQTNELYNRQYGDSEYEARLDHLLGSAGKNHLEVTESEIVFTGDRSLFSGQDSELSDHYGVRVKLQIQPE